MDFRDTCHGRPRIGAENERTGSLSQINDEIPPNGTPRRGRPHSGASRPAAIPGRAGIREAPGRTATEPNQAKRKKQLLRRPIGRGRKCPREWTLPGRHTPLSKNSPGYRLHPRPQKPKNAEIIRYSNMTFRAII